MKIFILILILIFSYQSWTKASDIRDFEIEGMSIGDSMLEYFDRNEIISIENKIISLANTFNFKAIKHGEYPSWKPVAENKLLDTVMNNYKNLFVFLLLQYHGLFLNQD